METRTLTRKDYELILEMDKKVYPTSSPVTKEIIKSWYINNPEFGAIFEENKEIVGVLIAIPLNKQSWKKLINGELKESEMNKKTIFNNSQDKELGIHIYHIEKLDGGIKEFYKTSLKYLASLLDNLKKKNSNLKVIGFSGLCVTNKGTHLFEKKFNCKERDFVIQEHIFQKNEQRIVLETNSKEIIQNKINEGFGYLTKCKMLVLYPEEKSIVWRYLK